MVIPRLIGNLYIFIMGYNGYINHPPIIGLMSLSPTIWIQNGSLDPFAHIEDMEMIGIIVSEQILSSKSLCLDMKPHRIDKATHLLFGIVVKIKRLSLQVIIAIMIAMTHLHSHLETYLYNGLFCHCYVR